MYGTTSSHYIVRVRYTALVILWFIFRAVGYILMPFHWLFAYRTMGLLVLLVSVVGLWPMSLRKGKKDKIILQN